MSHLADVPVWVAGVVSAFALLGSVLTLLGTLGLVRLGSFFARLHAPTLGSSWGAAGVLLASSILFTATGSRIVLHEVVIGVFIMMTSAVTMVALAGAALRRDRQEGHSPEGWRENDPAQNRRSDQP